MPVISLNIPPKTAFLALAFGAIALYADSMVNEKYVLSDDDGTENNLTYKRPLMTHLKNVLVADDFVSLRALWKLRSALDDVMNADFSACDCDMSCDHLRKIFTPVMPENARKRFVGVTSDLEKAQNTIRGINSVKTSASAIKNMELISQFADILPDGAAPLLQMKDMLSSVMPLMSMFGNSSDVKGKKGDFEDDHTDNIDCDDHDGGVYAVSAEDVIGENDDEYDSILEIMRLLKDG